MPETNAPKIIFADHVSFGGREGNWLNFSFPEGFIKHFQLPVNAVGHLYAEQAEPSLVQVAFRDDVTYEGHGDGFFHLRYVQRRLDFPYRLVRGIYQTDGQPMGLGLGIKKLHGNWSSLER